MACTDGGPSYEQIQTRRRISAALCAVLTVLEENGGLDSVFNLADWEEAGFPEEWLRGWWADHKAQDERRRKREALDRARKAKADRARAKLTPEEREALGV